MSDRYEHEIDELLYSLEGRLKREPLSRRVARRLRLYSSGLQGAFAAFLRRPPTEQFMIAAMVLVVLSLVLGPIGLGKMAFYASVLSMLFFVLAIAMSLASRHSPSYRKKWRGREIDYGRHGASVWTQLRRWFRQRRRY